MKRTLTHARLMEVLDYDQETGLFTWRSRRVDSRFEKIWNTQHAGKPAGSEVHHDYLNITIDGRKYYAHRLAIFYITGIMPAGGIDHKDTNRSNNRFLNLRPATQTQNNGNAKLHKTNSSGYKGVSVHRCTGKWQARIKIKGKTLWLGSYEDPKDAAAAYNRAAHEHFGEYARGTLPPLPY